MDTTIKTFEDNSELTVAHVAVMVAAGSVLAVIGSVAVVKYDAWSSKRAAKKAGITPNNT